MPTSQYKEQSGHRILQEVSHSTKYSVLPTLLINSFDFSLNWLNFLSLVQMLHQRVTVRVCIKLVDQFVHHCCDHSLLSGLLSVVDVGFWNLCYRFESPRASRNESLLVPGFVCFDGRRMFSLLGSERSWRPWCKLGVSTVVRGNLGDSNTLLCKSSPVFMCTTFSIQIASKVLKKSDCVRSCLIELPPFPLSKLQIAPTNWILMCFPSIFVHCNSGFIQVVLGFFLMLIGVHRIHGCKEYWMPISLQTFTSTLDDGVRVVSVPNVVDVLIEVVR